MFNRYTEERMVIRKTAHDPPLRHETMWAMKRRLSGIPFYQVDAFAEKPFQGNPAAVCLLDDVRSADWMQSVAGEMNLSETAFVRKTEEDYTLRWFTPTMEVELCGHATLASAHVMWSEGVVKKSELIRFHTRSGVLTCTRAQGAIELDFPAILIAERVPPAGLLEALGVQPSFIGTSQGYILLIVDSEAVVRDLKPNFNVLRSVLGIRGLIVSSLSTNPQFDFISRFFAPGCGVDEDPVTGSAHCCLAPFWSKRLGKSTMTAFQASHRGGIVQVRILNERVILGGTAITVLRGELLNS